MSDVLTVFNFIIFFNSLSVSNFWILHLFLPRFFYFFYFSIKFSWSHSQLISELQRQRKNQTTLRHSPSTLSDDTYACNGLSTSRRLFFSCTNRLRSSKHLWRVVHVIIRCIFVFIRLLFSLILFKNFASGRISICIWRFIHVFEKKVLDVSERFFDGIDCEILFFCFFLTCLFQCISQLVFSELTTTLLSYSCCNRDF